MNEFIALVILLFLSGLFSGSETALIALSMGRVESLVKQGRAGAKALYQLKRDPSRMLITILIGNNLVNIAASAIATVIATEWFGSLGPGIAVGVLTIVILIFGEITPKSLATRYSERISLSIAPLMYGLMRLIFPLVWVFGRFATWVHEATGGGRDPTVTELELIGMARYGEAEGTIERNERLMIERIFAFNDLQARDVMTPRSHVFALPAALKVVKALPKAKHSGYARIPVFEDQPDEISKVVYLRDILGACAAKKTAITLGEIARPLLFVPQNQPIDELFDVLRNRKRRLAVVVDEFGVIQGIVTLEDVLEELVGELYDESDKPRGIKKLGKNEIAVDGGVELRVVEEFFGVSLSGKPTDKVSLWVLHHAERIPGVDEQFVIDEMSVTVAKASRRHIRQVIISRLTKSRLGTKYHS
ncbi:MAG: HlyC/CorC family transporter [Gammaproteobacteria bacterium]|nr:HlyC/CorC family transporter [Gammaproteobacteria bacterium]